MKATHKAVSLITDVGLMNSSYVVEEVQKVIQELMLVTCSSAAIDSMKYWENVDKHIEKLKKKIWIE
jgi:hypothetical protein